MPTINRQVQAANLLSILFDGQAVGIISSLRISGDFGLTGEAGIGDNVVVENVPGIAQVRVSASGIVLIQKNLWTLGIAPTSSVRDILAGRVIDVGVYSRTSGAWLLKAIDCSLASIDASVNSGRSVQFDGTFNARDMAGTFFG